MMGDVAKGLKSFKKGMREDDEPSQRRERRRAERRSIAPGPPDRPDPEPPRAADPPAPPPPSTTTSAPDRRARIRPMFGVDTSELLIVAVVALLFIGPKELPQGDA